MSRGSRGVAEREPEVVSEKFFSASECAIVFVVSLLGVSFHRSSLAVNRFRRQSLKVTWRDGTGIGER